MSAWTRLRDWWRGCSDQAITEAVAVAAWAASVAETVTNDEMVTAYEWITYGGENRLLPSLGNAPYFAGLYGAPDATCATLRKLGAA